MTWEKALHRRWTFCPACLKYVLRSLKLGSVSVISAIFQGFIGKRQKDLRKRVHESKLDHRSCPPIFIQYRLQSSQHKSLSELDTHATADTVPPAAQYLLVAL